jgi:hypothetical protein
VACDNTSALKPTAVDYMPHPNHKNFDLMSALWKTLQESPLEWKPVHVYGHQDRKIKDAHRRLASLNCQMDALAKQFWSHLFLTLEDHVAAPMPIHNEGWSLWDANSKIASPSKKHLYGLLTNPSTQMWWVRHGRFPLEALPLIDWDTNAQGMKMLKPSRRRWVTKHASENCGVGATLVKWKYQDDPQCPRCGEPEDTTHVLLCTGDGATEVWKEGMSSLADYLTDSNTHPGILQAVLDNLQAWRCGCTSRSETDNPDIASAVASQNTIGWKNMLKGLLSKQWQQLQQRHYNRDRRKKSARKWAQGLHSHLHKIAWALWDHRNEVKHKTKRRRQERMNHKMNQEICRLYRQGASSLAPSERHHFRSSIMSLLQKPNGHKRHWLRNVTSARCRQARRQAHNNELDPTTPEQQLLLNWMSSNRPR